MNGDQKANHLMTSSGALLLVTLKENIGSSPIVGDTKGEHWFKNRCHSTVLELWFVAANRLAFPPDWTSQKCT